MESKNLRQGERISKDATTSSVDVCIAGTSYAKRAHNRGSSLKVQHFSSIHKGLCWILELYTYKKTCHTTFTRVYCRVS